MPEKTFSQRWQDYQPSKGVWFWSCVTCIVLTMIVGFTWGGWVTGGTARTMEAQAAQDAREQLVASICVDRFVKGPNASAQLAALKEAGTWERDDLIEEGGWITIDGLEDQVSGAADVCAEKLAAMENIPAAAGKPDTAAAGAATAG